MLLIFGCQILNCVSWNETLCIFREISCTRIPGCPIEGKLTSVHLMTCCCHNDLTHRGPVTPHDDIDLGEHWLRLWLVACRHQTITWTNSEFSLVQYFDIDLRAMWQQVPKLLFCKMSLKSMLLKLQLHLYSCCNRSLISSWCGNTKRKPFPVSVVGGVVVENEPVK